MHYATCVIWGVDMKIAPDGNLPIYRQIAQWLENEILSGNIETDEKVYSQYQLAQMFNINPATAAKGLNILADADVLYKKRGLGMFVSPQARDMIARKRRDEVLQQMVDNLVREAGRLDVGEGELLAMVRAAIKGEVKNR